VDQVKIKYFLAFEADRSDVVLGGSLGDGRYARCDSHHLGQTFKEGATGVVRLTTAGESCFYAALARAIAVDAGQWQMTFTGWRETAACGKEGPGGLKWCCVAARTWISGFFRVPRVAGAPHATGPTRNASPVIGRSSRRERSGTPVGAAFAQTLQRPFGEPLGHWWESSYLMLENVMVLLLCRRNLQSVFRCRTMIWEISMTISQIVPVA
jgi:hypothetical protein